MKTKFSSQLFFLFFIMFAFNACTSLNIGSASKEITVIIKKSTVTSPHILHKIREDLVFKKYIRSVNFINIPEPVIQIEMDPGSVKAASLDYDDPIGGYLNYIDMDTFIDFMLLNEISKNVDGYRLSTFMYKNKDSKDGRLKMGPIWDLTSLLGMSIITAEPDGPTGKSSCWDGPLMKIITRYPFGGMFFYRIAHLSAKPLHDGWN